MLFRAIFRWVMIGMVAIFLAGCGGSKNPESNAEGTTTEATPPPPPPAPLPQELFPLMKQQTVSAGFTVESRGKGVVYGVGRATVGFVEFIFRVNLRNNSQDKLTVRLPEYFFVSPEKPGQDADLMPVADPLYVCKGEDQTLTLGPGEAGRLEIKRVWHAGNPMRPPALPSDDKTELKISEPPGDSILLRLARKISESPSSFTGGSVALAMASGTVPEIWLKDRLKEMKYSDVRLIRQLLEQETLEIANHKAFEEARQNYEEILTSVKRWVVENQPVSLTVDQMRTCAGDPELLKALHPLFDPTRPADLPQPPLYLLKDLGPLDTETLNLNFRYALQAPTVDQRMEAARVGALLGDARMIPILVQYRHHPKIDDEQVRQRVLWINTFLNDEWLKAGYMDKTRNLDELEKEHGSINATPLQGITSADHEALRQFLDSKKNLEL